MSGQAQQRYHCRYRPGGVAQEEWLRDESEHPYKFVPTKGSGKGRVDLAMKAGIIEPIEGV